MAKSGSKGKPSPQKNKQKGGIKEKSIPPVSTPPSMENDGNMDKIRDILFGNQMRDVEKRFAIMEEQLGKELANVKDESQNRMEAFEVFFKKEMGVLKDRLKRESDERASADERLISELKETVQSLNKKNAQVEETLAERATDLQEQILEQSKKLSAEIQNKYEKSTNNLKSAVTELDDSKVDRAALAEFLIEIAMRLSGDQSYQSLINPEK